MTRVDFYELPDVDLEARNRFACRLAHKAVAGGRRVHVHVGSAAAAQDLDALMWEYPNHRFLPHGVSGDAAARNAPVVIGHTEPAADADQVLINLAAEIPTFFGRFERVAEIIVDQTRADSRKHYRFYRDRGYPLEHHAINERDDR